MLGSNAAAGVFAPKVEAGGSIRHRAAKAGKEYLTEDGGRSVTPRAEAVEAPHESMQRAT